MRLWVDTDIGDNPDDVLALALAAAHPDIDLAGVSTVSGDVEARARAARTLVDTSTPVVARHDDLPGEIERAAPDALVAIGPLGNVARLLDRGVGLPENVVVMGGALRPVQHRGAVREIESNFGADPAATRLVLDWSDAVVVPLDVTVGMAVSDDEAAALRAARPDIAGSLAAWRHELVLHDPLAVLVAVGDVDTQSEFRALAADRDGRLVERAGARRHEVVISANTQAARRKIVGILSA